MLPSLISFLSRTSCFLCGGGDNPSKVCPACLQVHMLCEDLMDFTMEICEEEMTATVKRWGNSKVFFMREKPNVEDWYGPEGCE